MVAAAPSVAWSRIPLCRCTTFVSAASSHGWQQGLGRGASRCCRPPRAATARCRLASKQRIDPSCKMAAWPALGLPLRTLGAGERQEGRKNWPSCSVELQQPQLLGGMIPLCQPPLAWHRLATCAAALRYMAAAATAHRRRCMPRREGVQPAERERRAEHGSRGQKWTRQAGGRSLQSGAYHACVRWREGRSSQVRGVATGAARLFTAGTYSGRPGRQGCRQAGKRGSEGHMA